MKDFEGTAESKVYLAFGGEACAAVVVDTSVRVDVAREHAPGVTRDHDALGVERAPRVDPLVDDAAPGDDVAASPGAAPPAAEGHFRRVGGATGARDRPPRPSPAASRRLRAAVRDPHARPTRAQGRGHAHDRRAPGHRDEPVGGRRRVGGCRARRAAVRARRAAQRRRRRRRRPRSHVFAAPGGRRHPRARRIRRGAKVVVVRPEHRRGMRRRHRTRHVHREGARLRVRPGRRLGPTNRRGRPRAAHRPRGRRQHLRGGRRRDPQRGHGQDHLGRGRGSRVEQLSASLLQRLQLTAPPWEDDLATYADYYEADVRARQQAEWERQQAWAQQGYQQRGYQQQQARYNPTPGTYSEDYYAAPPPPAAGIPLVRPNQPYERRDADGGYGDRPPGRSPPGECLGRRARHRRLDGPGRRGRRSGISSTSTSTPTAYGYASETNGRARGGDTNRRVESPPAPARGRVGASRAGARRRRGEIDLYGRNRSNGDAPRPRAEGLRRRRGHVVKRYPPDKNFSHSSSRARRRALR